jgi:hypothetical protein
MIIFSAMKNRCSMVPGLFRGLIAMGGLPSSLWTPGTAYSET